jgi:PAS domain S-box-containing protein
MEANLVSLHFLMYCVRAMSIDFTLPRLPECKEEMERSKAISNIPKSAEAGDVSRQSAEQFRLLVDGVQDYAIFMLSPQGYVVSWNKGAERIKGYKADEIIGKHFSCFYPLEAIAQGQPALELRKAVEQGHTDEEGWRVRKGRATFLGQCRDYRHISGRRPLPGIRENHARYDRARAHFAGPL